ncbi:MAG: hypothetical protein ABIL02_04195 [candidate division WOR-3 bacterium]
MTHRTYRPGRVEKKSFTLYSTQYSVSTKQNLEEIFDNFIKKYSKYNKEILKVVENSKLSEVKIPKGGDNREKKYISTGAHNKERGSK